MFRTIEHWIYNNLDLGDTFSVFFAAKIYDRAKQIEKDVIEGNMEYADGKAALHDLAY